MKTDALFYQLFCFEPQALFELLRLPMPDAYAFESITLKTTEKRLDGLFRPLRGEGPNVFLEIQSYRDPKIYWRLFREITAYYEQSDSGETPFLAIVLFLNPQDDPGAGAFSVWENAAPNRLLRVALEECLSGLPESRSVLTVLRPLTLLSADPPFPLLQEWARNLEGLDFPTQRRQFLLELLEYSILQRFPQLSLKEIQTMLRLTPLEQTTAGQELIQQGLQTGIQQGLQTGIQQGRWIGQIQTCQRLLKRAVSSEETLQNLSFSELRTLAQELDQLLMEQRRS